MTRNRFGAGVIVGVVAGAAIGAGIGEWRHRPSTAPPADRAKPAALAGAPASPTERADLATMRQSNEILRRRVAALEQRLAAAPAPGSDGDDRTPDDIFSAETRDPAWATSREGQLQDRLGRYFAIRPIAVECRSSCCRVQIQNDDMEAHELDLQSDVGLNGRWNWRAHGFASDDQPAYVIVCDEYDPAEYPDRAVERDALLRAARPALEACSPVDPSLVLRVVLRLDEQGAVESVDSVAEPIGHPAAECAERAILSAAAFAPSRRGTSVPVIVNLPLSRAGRGF